MAKGGFRPGGGRPPLLNPDGSRKHPIRVRNKAAASSARVAATPKRPAATPSKAAASPAALPVNPFMSVDQALATSSLPPPYEALVPNPVELPVATAADVPGGMPDVPGADVPDPADLESLTPLQYMLREMNHRRNDAARRDKLAIAAAPFVHARAGEVGKKIEKEEAAKKAGSGKFGSAPPPLRAVK